MMNYSIRSSENTRLLTFSARISSNVRVCLMCQAAFGQQDVDGQLHIIEPRFSVAADYSGRTIRLCLRGTYVREASNHSRTQPIH